MSHIVEKGNIEAIINPKDKSEIAFKLDSTDKPFGLLKIGDTTSWKNDELVDIYDVQFTDISILDFPVIEKIPANSSLKYNFTAYTNETINTQLTSKLIWFYKEIVLSDEDTFYVNVTDSGFIPSTINADINDIIIFTNVGNEEHTISEFNNLFVFNNAFN